MIRIILADDHAVMRRGLRLVIEENKDFQVVGEASDGREAVALVEELKPDLVVLDISMPDMNGIEAARQISEKQSGVSIVVLSMHSDESYVLRALKAGARGDPLKESAESDFILAIRSVSAGKAFFSPAVSRLLVEDYVRQLQDKDIEDSYELLTQRERELLQLIAEGKSNKDVANMLNLSLYTVENPPRQSDGEAQPAQRAGTHPLRRPQGRYLLTSATGRAAWLSCCFHTDHAAETIRITAAPSTGVRATSNPPQRTSSSHWFISDVSDNSTTPGLGIMRDNTRTAGRQSLPATSL
ncbi:MAG: response regulator transcription factor [Paludibaculum sp.]